MKQEYHNQGTHIARVQAASTPSFLLPNHEAMQALSLPDDLDEGSMHSVS